jgi:hypothetical protein
MERQNSFLHKNENVFIVCLKSWHGTCIIYRQVKIVEITKTVSGGLRV